MRQAATRKLFFNRFREEDPTIHSFIRSIDAMDEETILIDNNLVTIKGTEEYALNIDEHTPYQSNADFFVYPLPFQYAFEIWFCPM